MFQYSPYEEVSSDRQKLVDEKKQRDSSQRRHRADQVINTKITKSQNRYLEHRINFFAQLFMWFV